MRSRLSSRIRREDDDVFFHQSFIEKDLEEGDEVEFEIEEDGRGARAADLRRP
jgi:cold shock CspA family protein